MLDNLAITNTTIVDQEEQLRRTFTVGASSANELAGFLETNERNLISLAATSRPVLGLFAEYSPVYPCLLDGLTRSVPRIGETFGTDGDPALNLNIQVSFPPRNPYAPGDQPAYLDKTGPDCMGLDNIDEEIAQAQSGRVLLPVPAERRHRVRRERGAPRARLLRGTVRTTVATTRTRRRGHDGERLPSELAGSTAELDFVRSILAYQTGAEPGDVSDLSASTLAPLLRGKRVMLP